jgi:hypothetical protein
LPAAGVLQEAAQPCPVGDAELRERLVKVRADRAVKQVDLVGDLELTALKIGTPWLK